MNIYSRQTRERCYKKNVYEIVSAMVVFYVIRFVTDMIFLNINSGVSDADINVARIMAAECNIMATYILWGLAMCILNKMLQSSRRTYALMVFMIMFSESVSDDIPVFTLISCNSGAFFHNGIYWLGIKLCAIGILYAVGLAVTKKSDIYVKG